MSPSDCAQFLREYLGAMFPSLEARQGGEQCLLPTRRWVASAEDGSNEAPKTPSGMGHGKGCPLPSRLGVWGASWAFRLGPERPETHFGIFWRPQNTPFFTYMPMLLSSSNSVSCHIWGARPRFGAIDPCPNVELRLRQPCIIIIISLSSVTTIHKGCSKYWSTDAPGLAISHFIQWSCCLLVCRPVYNASY